MLFGCSSCCNPPGCTPCTKCANKCLKVTLSGFSGGSGCNDCETLNGTYTLTRGNGPQPTVLVATDPPGNATFSVALSKNTNTGTYGIKSVTVDSPGSGYASDVTLTYSILGGTVACDDPPSLTATTAVEEAGISSVTVTNPGTIWPTESLPANCCDGVPVSFCGYSRSEVITCDSGAKCRRIFLTLGELEHTLAVTIDGRRVLRATMPVDEADCTALEFSPGDVTSDCESNGIITVEEGDCSDTPLESCECPSMPAQISLELQGVPNNVFVRNLITGCGPLYAGHWDECGGEPQQIVIWQPYAGGPDYSIPMPPGFVACGDGYSDVRVFQSWKYYPDGHMLPSNGTVILDLAYTEPFACVGSQQGRYIYSGFLPSPPGRFNRVTDCTGGDLSVPVFVEL